MDKILMLRTCGADMRGNMGLVWPESGPVECNDWDPEPRCGGGLHGLPGGRGDVGYLDVTPDARWLVWETNADEVIDLVDKAKAPRGTVVYCGDRDGAVQYLADHGCPHVPWARVTVGDHEIASVGDYGKAIAGDYGMAIAGYDGIATAGYSGTAIAGDGTYSTATAGYAGRAIAGYCGTATAGNYGIAMVGLHGSAAAGEDGQILFGWHDAVARRIRTAVGYVGQDGIEPNTLYRCDDRGRLVRAGEDEGCER